MAEKRVQTVEERKRAKSERNRRYHARHASDPDYLERRTLTARAWRARNPEKTRAYCRNMDKQRDTALRRMYGIDAATYDRMLLDQGGACAICRRSSDRRLAVDHCHETGRVRGLLCYRCNTMLGHARDSALVLSSGAAYLQRCDDGR